MPADGGMQGGSGGRGEAANQDDMTKSLSAVLKALISLLILFAPAHPPYVYVKLCSRRDSSLQNIFHERECKQWIIKLLHSKMIANNPFNPFESDGQISFKKVEKRGSQDYSLCHSIHFPFMLLNEMGFFPFWFFICLVHLPDLLQQHYLRNTLASVSPEVTSISLCVFVVERSSSRRASEEGWKLPERELGKPDWVCPHQCGLCCGPGQCLEVSIPLLQKWRR